MNSGEPVSLVAAQIQSALESARQQAREQLAAAWQMHIARVEDELRSRWGAHLESLLNERFMDLSGKLVAQVEATSEARLREEMEAARADERRSTIRKMSEHLNQASRRLRAAERQDEWSSALVDAALGFCDRAAVFSLQGSQLRLERCSQPIGAWEAPVSEAPALAQALDSLEPLVAAYGPGQLSQSLSDALGQLAPRLYIFPIARGDKAVAALTAEGDNDNIDPNALELLAGLASAVYEVRAAANERAESAALVKLEARPAPPPWLGLPADEQELHLRAQRFARVQVAEMRLYKAGAVQAGREDRSIYRLLREEIDKSREQYRRQFVENCASMTDYLHVEMVKTLANDDEDLLGTDYPGKLA
jgi:hypothetical protein